METTKRKGASKPSKKAVFASLLSEYTEKQQYRATLRAKWENQVAEELAFLNLYGVTMTKRDGNIWLSREHSSYVFILAYGSGGLNDYILYKRVWNPPFGYKEDGKSFVNMRWETLFTDIIQTWEMKPIE